MTSASNRPVAAPAQLPGPRPQRPSNTADVHTFLTQQAADAQTAIHQTLTEMQATAREVANVRWWTQHYPWSAVGAAAVRGYVVTTAVLAPPAPEHPRRIRPPPAPPGRRPCSPSCGRSCWGYCATPCIRRHRPPDRAR